MRQSVIDLETFYTSRLGRLAEIMAGRRLNGLWPDLTGRHLLGFGYTAPYMRRYIIAAKSAVFAMPAAQGAVVMGSASGVSSVLTQDDCLPFQDASFDNVIVAHGLEEAVDVHVILRELWRVTMPEGRIVIIAPNRRGLWAQFDKTPFGAGRPFSRVQLRKALEQSGFAPSMSAGAVYAPPMRLFARPRLAMASEKMGETLWPHVSGLVMVEAVKRLYAKRDGSVAEPAVRRPIKGAVIADINQHSFEAKSKQP